VYGLCTAAADATRLERAFGKKSVGGFSVQLTVAYDL
jgi:hypothetical protein